MKKKDFTSLKLNKKSISNLTKNLIGGTDWPESVRACPFDGPTQWLTCAADCDIPTINDSCFSFCRDKCNDF